MISEQSPTSKPLKGKRIAFLVAEGFEQIELTRPWQDIKRAGATVERVFLNADDVDGFTHLERTSNAKVDAATLAEAKAEDYDGLVLPGGITNPDALRMNKSAVSFVRAFFEQNKPVAAICHAPWTMIEAGVVNGRTLTPLPSVATDIGNAASQSVNQSALYYHGLITSRAPADLDAFCAKAIEEFAKSRHGEKPQSRNSSTQTETMDATMED